MNTTHQAQILLVDDEPEILEVISEALVHSGYAVICAKDGAEALQLLQTEKPDAILSDISMPKMNGLELIYEIRKMGLETPCVLLTAHFNQKNIIKALRIGVSDFLAKPFQIEELLKTLGNAAKLGIEIKKLEAELDELCKKSNMSPERRQSFKRFKLSLMIMGSHPSSSFYEVG